MIAEIEQVALHSPSPILLSGPTGAGKSMLARRIFELKKARHLIKGEFVDVNCATLRGDGAASALFGHKKRCVYRRGGKARRLPENRRRRRAVFGRNRRIGLGRTGHVAQSH